MYLKPNIRTIRVSYLPPSPNHSDRPNNHIVLRTKLRHRLRSSELLSTSTTSMSSHKFDPTEILNSSGALN